MQENPGHPGKGQGHCFIFRENLTSYIWGWCTVWLIGSQLQSIVGSVPCMQRKWAVMYPTVISTPHSRHNIRLQVITQYESPTPLHFSSMVSYNVPTRNAPGWHVILRDFATLAASPNLL